VGDAKGDEGLPYIPNKALCEDRSERSVSPLGFQSAATFAMPTGTRIEVSVAAIVIGAVVKAMMLLGRFFQPARYVEMISPAVSPERGFDHLFDGGEQCFIFSLIQSWPPLRAVPWNL
jgi:hypothetical protein